MLGMKQKIKCLSEAILDDEKVAEVRACVKYLKAQRLPNPPNP